MPTTFDTDRHIRRALRAGASGFLLKHTPPARIAEAIRLVAAGEPMLTPDVFRRVLEFAAEPGPDPRREKARALIQRLTDLTNRVQVALLVHDTEEH